MHSAWPVAIAIRYVSEIVVIEIYGTGKVVNAVFMTHCVSGDVHDSNFITTAFKSPVSRER